MYSDFSLSNFLPTTHLVMNLLLRLKMEHPACTPQLNSSCLQFAVTLPDVSSDHFKVSNQSQQRTTTQKHLWFLLQPAARAHKKNGCASSSAFVVSSSDQEDRLLLLFNYHLFPKNTSNTAILSTRCPTLPSIHQSGHKNRLFGFLPWSQSFPRSYFPLKVSKIFFLASKTIISFVSSLNPMMLGDAWADRALASLASRCTFFQLSIGKYPFHIFERHMN
jgi:hypothetical protein